MDFKSYVKYRIRGGLIIGLVFDFFIVGLFVATNDIGVSIGEHEITGVAGLAIILPIVLVTMSVLGLIYGIASYAVYWLIAKVHRTDNDSWE